MKLPVMNRKERVKRSKYLPEQYKDVYEKDYDELVDELKEDTQSETRSLIDTAQSCGMKLFI